MCKRSWVWVRPPAKPASRRKRIDGTAVHYASIPTNPWPRCTSGTSLLQPRSCFGSLRGVEFVDAVAEFLFDDRSADFQGGGELPGIYAEDTFQKCNLPNAFKLGKIRGFL